jgi:poly(3-hydroxybutyrate) depolymerase
MKKSFAASIAVAAIAGSLAATPASAQRVVAVGVAAPGRYYEPSPYRAGPGLSVYFGGCEWVTQRFWDGHGWRVRRVRVCG